MDSLHFRDEMLIPNRNGDIYFSVYELEHWLRRICLAACMIRHGPDWPAKIDSRIARALKGRLDRNRELFYLAAETNENLIWATLHNELHDLIFDHQLWPIIERLTGFARDRLHHKLREFKDIRNVLAHNRAFSAQTEIVFRGLEAALKAGIENFKSEILYSEYDILDHKDTEDLLNVTFQKHMEGNDWGKYQAFLGKNDFFYEFVCLPVQRSVDPAYISGYKLLSRYEAHLNIVVAFTVNKEADEYIVLIPKNSDRKLTEKLCKTFTSDPFVWTSKPFTEQDPQFILHPKVWFYENRRNVPE